MPLHALLIYIAGWRLLGLAMTHTWVDDGPLGMMCFGWMMVGTVWLALSWAIPLERLMHPHFYDRDHPDHPARRWRH